MRMLVLASAAHKPDDEEIRRMVAADLMPDGILAKDAFGACSLDERDLGEIRGLRGRLLRRLPLPLALSFEAWRRRDDFDVVLSWGERLSFTFALLLSLTRGPRLGHIAILMWPFDSSSPSHLKRVVKRVLFPVLARHGMDRLVVPAPHQAELVVRRWGITQQRLVAANWSVDTHFWRPMDGAGDLICSVGREMRDYATLVDVLRTLDIPCHIAAGTGTLNQAFSSLDPRATNVGEAVLPPKVTLGPRSPFELRELYARARLVVVPVMPSDSDNGVTAIVEAMAMGRAIVSTDTIGRVRSLEHGVNCLLVPPRDPQALRAAIEELWNDPERCAQLGAAGRERVLAQHSVGQWVSAISDAAADVVSSTAR